MLINLIKDIRYGLRTLLRSPGFAAAAIITIALGIGVNAGVFTILNGIVFRDLPAPDPRALVSISQEVEGGEATAVTGAGTFTAAEYDVYADRSQTLSGVLAHSNPIETTLGGDVPREIIGAFVSCNYFDVLQQPPALGRGLTARDCAPGAGPAIVLGHQLWTSSYDADPEVLGRTIELNRQLFTVVGIAAEDTYNASPMRTAYFAPLSIEPLIEPNRARFEDAGHRWLYLIGRRDADAAGNAQVQAELGVIAAQIDAQEPGRTTTLTIAKATPAIVPPFFRDTATGAVVVVMFAFGLILLIACANVANLLLARGTARSREIGIRMALGASRARVVRQLLVETMLIAIAGGVVGSILAFWSFQALVAVVLSGGLHPEMPPLQLHVDLSPDYRVFGYAFALTLCTGLLFGLAPALHTTKPDLNTVIKQDASGGGRSRSGGRFRSTLVGIQVALSMVLMVATGLLLRGLHATHTVDPGFAYEDIAHLSFGTDYGPSHVLDETLLDEVAALPGVEAAAYASQTPLGESIFTIAIRLPGEDDSAARRSQYDSITLDYFRMFELPIVRGRNFTAAEGMDAGADVERGPVIVSETTARNLWGDADPLGQTLLLGDRVLEVVGVVRDAQLNVLGRVDPYYIFEPKRSGGELLVKSRADFATTAAALQALVRGRDPTQATRVLPLDANVSWSRGVSGMVTTLGAGLGVLALVLAAVGIYGVVSYAVTERYREIGIRMALGARIRNVVVLILQRTMRPVVIGAVLGFAAALAVSGVLSAVLFGVSPADPLGIGGAAAVVLGVALAAGLAAVRFATRTDPITTLQRD